MGKPNFFFQDIILLYFFFKMAYNCLVLYRYNQIAFVESVPSGVSYFTETVDLFFHLDWASKGRDEK